MVLVKQRGPHHQRQQSQQQGACTQVRCACACHASSAVVVNRCINDDGGRRQRQRKVESRRVGMTAFLGGWHEALRPLPEREESERHHPAQDCRMEAKSGSGERVARS